MKSQKVREIGGWPILGVVILVIAFTMYHDAHPDLPPAVSTVVYVLLAAVVIMCIALLIWAEKLEKKEKNEKAELKNI